jgi:hypothetical protein
MSHAPLPKDCYDVETAAHLLAVSSLELYKILRNNDWLFTKTSKNEKCHNLPKEWAKKAGYLTTQERSYKAPYNPNIQQMYRVAILTRAGLEVIAKMMNKELFLPVPMALTTENAQIIQAQKPDETANKEREKCLEELRNMGLYRDKAG